MVLGIGRYPIFLGRRKEKIMRLYPIDFGVTQALQHSELANELKVGETNFFANFSSCCRFERFVWLNLALWQDKLGEILLLGKGEFPCKGEIHALVLLSQDNTASSDPFLDGWHTTIPGVINNNVLIVHLHALLHTQQPKHNDFREGTPTSGSYRGLAYKKPEPPSTKGIHAHSEVSHDPVYHALCRLGCP